MIDHLDKQTQPMNLEPKRGRGRPATGQALSNADRQRAYRERQKTQRNEKGAGPEWDDVRKLTRYIDDLGEQLAEASNRAQAAEEKAEQCRLIAVEIGDRCQAAEQHVKELQKDLALKDTQLRSWISRAEEAERELEQRNGKSFWHVEMCTKGKRTWMTVGGEGSEPFGSKAAAEAFAEKIRSDGSTLTVGWKYRVVPA